MSISFNPVKLLSRRRSKSRSLSQSGTSEGSTKPSCITQKVSRKSTFDTSSSTSTPISIRKKLFGSLRRARSPRRRTIHNEPDPLCGVSVRTSSVPSQRSEIQPSIPQNSESVTFTYQTKKRCVSQPESPAPLAEGDCFELTDVSDAENDTLALGAKVIQDIVNLTRRDSEYFDEEPVTFKHDRESDQSDTNHSDDTETQCEPSDSDTAEKTDTNELWQADNEAIIDLEPVEYETEYPLVNELISQKELESFESKTDVDDQNIESEDEPSESSSDDEASFTMQNYRSQSEDQASEKQSPKDEDSDKTSRNSHQYEQYIQEDTYVEPDIEVQHDPFQDPFHQAELVASGDAPTIQLQLTTPAILVTSASTGSLQYYMEAEKTERPSRPPPPPLPPVNKPSSASKMDSHEAIPRRPPPPSIQAKPFKEATGQESTVKTNKKKLFGVVDIGPLPSDLDSNFPFRKHLEKSIIPNPRKAIQRIIRGETKEERRLRKEKEELGRILKETNGAINHPVKEESADLKEFKNIFNRIEDTLKGSTSVIQKLKRNESAALESAAENWADFASAFPVDNKSDEQKDYISQEPPWTHSAAKSEDHEFRVLVGADSKPSNPNMADQSGQFVEAESIVSGDLLGDLEQTEVVVSDITEKDPFESTNSSDAEDQHLSDTIDDFLGINTAEVIKKHQFVSSNPLEVLEQLKPRTRENPLLDLGIEPQATQMDITLDGSNSISLINVETPTEAREPLGHSGTLDSNTSSNSDSPASSEIMKAELPDDIEPTNVPKEDSSTDDGDAKWPVSSSPIIDSKTTAEEKELYGNNKPSQEFATAQNARSSQNTVRPRVRPVRQATLSGNNPFRRKSAEDSQAMDDLTRLASGLVLASRPYSRLEYGDSSESHESLSNNAKTAQAIPNENEEPAETTPDLMTSSKFDPLQTIYPDSDKEPEDSSEEDEIEGKLRKLVLAVNINEKNDTFPGASITTPVVPAIPGPPKPNSVRAPKPQPQVSNGNQVTIKLTEPETVITFDFDGEDIPKPFISCENAFNWVDLASTKTNEPEPPRPDTPDPELEIPYNPVASENTYYHLWLRYPEKKTRVKQLSKYTTDRYWREIAISFTNDHGRKVVNIHEIDENTKEVTAQPNRSVRIEPYMQLSREKLQQYDKYGKLHVFKLKHVSYKEFVGIRPEKFTIKNLHHLVTHKPKQNVAVDHLPVYTEILKFGSLDQSKIRTVMPVFEDALMQIASYKDSTLAYTREEVCCYVIDEYVAKISTNCVIQEQKARTRVFCTAFVNSGPNIVLGLNDKWRYGREVVRRSDILPVMHDEWISIRKPEFHSCVDMEAYEKDHMLKFYPLDGCRFELLRFRVSLMGNRELPMQLKSKYSIDGRRVSMRCELMVPGYFTASNRKGAVPCEDVQIHIPVPEDWIYHFRVEKHHKYGSVHSTLRKPGKIKGLERLTQMAQSLLPASILEASIGLAKYEHLYKAIVWRIPRIPDKNEASCRPHLLTCKLLLAAHDTVPKWETLVRQGQVEFTMPTSAVSGATVRSISVDHQGVTEKFVKYTAKYRITMNIDYMLGALKESSIKSLLDNEDDPPAEAQYDRKDEGGRAGQETQPDTEPESRIEMQQEEGGVEDLLGLGLPPLEYTVTETVHSGDTAPNLL